MISWIIISNIIIQEYSWFYRVSAFPIHAIPTHYIFRCERRKIFLPRWSLFSYSVPFWTEATELVPIMSLRFIFYLHPVRDVSPMPQFSGDPMHFVHIHVLWIQVITCQKKTISPAFTCPETLYFSPLWGDWAELSSVIFYAPGKLSVSHFSIVEWAVHATRNEGSRYTSFGLLLSPEMTA